MVWLRAPVSRSASWVNLQDQMPVALLLLDFKDETKETKWLCSRSWRAVGVL